MRKSGWLTGLLWLLAGLLLAAAAITVTGACALGLPGQGRPWLSFCPAPPAVVEDPAGAARLALERNRTETLEDRLRRLEVRLAATEDCAPPDPPPPTVEVAEPPPEPSPEPPPEPPPEPEEPVEVAEVPSPIAAPPSPGRRPTAPERPPPPPPPPAPPAPPQDIPEDAWENRDVSFLEGCWNLISDYRLTDINTGRITNVRSWQMCFDANGGGRQTIVFENGARCNAPVRGRFPGQRLMINDLSDVRCDNGTLIFRREVSCDRRADGTAECFSRQPGRPNTGTRIILRR